MGNTYLEFMSELYISLEELEKTWWSVWIKRSIQKYETENDVVLFLSAFGGNGNFNDEELENEITRSLKNITYECAKVINSNESKEINDILSEIKLKYIVLLEYWKKSPDDNIKKGLEIEKLENEITYINYLMSNYKDGNLHFITEDYINEYQHVRAK